MELPEILFDMDELGVEREAGQYWYQWALDGGAVFVDMTKVVTSGFSFSSSSVSSKA